MLDTRDKAVQYKKLNQLFDYHRVQLKKFLTRVWAFYDLLDRFRKIQMRKRRENWKLNLTSCFSTENGYEEILVRSRWTVSLIISGIMSVRLSNPSIHQPLAIDIGLASLAEVNVV